MKRRDVLEFYTDYLLASPKYATATGLSNALDNHLTHDYISDFLCQDTLDMRAFWKEVKPFVRKIENDQSCICIDDVIIAKPHTTENEVVCYHFDHQSGRQVKGINVLNFLLTSTYQEQQVSCPVAYDVIRKTHSYLDVKTGQQKRKSETSKNELVQTQLHRLVFINQVKFRYVLFDTWFSASKNLVQIHHKFKKQFVCPLKTNRLVALSYADKLAGNFIPVSDVELGKGQSCQVWVKGLDFPVTLSKQIFINKDDSTASLLLITNDLELNYQQMRTIYQKRWKVEEMHKSLKQNVLLGKSPTKMERSQCNHIFAAMLAFIKLERLKVKEHLNHFAIKAKLQLRMVKAALDELYKLRIKAG